MGLVLWIVVFVVSLSVKVGLALGMPSFLVGVLIMGIGTSLPELSSSIFATVAGNTEIVIGNVLGSNITNIFLVLGLAGIVGKGIRIRYDFMRLDLPFLLGSSFLLSFMIWDTRFTVGEAMLSLGCLVLYLLHSVWLSRRRVERKRHKASLKTWAWVVVSPVGIYVSAKYTVQAVIALSVYLHIGSEVIAMSAVALGTSLPEVLVTIAAVKKGNAELAVGNIIGSNIFNTFAVMGVPGLIGGLTIPRSVLGFSLPMSIAAAFLYVIVIIDRRLNRWE